MPMVAQRCRSTEDKDDIPGLAREIVNHDPQTIAQGLAHDQPQEKPYTRIGRRPSKAQHQLFDRPGDKDAEPDLVHQVVRRHGKTQRVQGPLEQVLRIRSPKRPFVFPIHTA